MARSIHQDKSLLSK